MFSNLWSARANGFHAWMLVLRLDLTATISSLGLGLVLGHGFGHNLGLASVTLKQRSWPWWLDLAVTLKVTILNHGNLHYEVILYHSSILYHSHSHLMYYIRGQILLFDVLHLFHCISVCKDFLLMYRYEFHPIFSSCYCNYDLDPGCLWRGWQSWPC